jgi:hypothetical protein
MDYQNEKLTVIIQIMLTLTIANDKLSQDAIKAELYKDIVNLSDDQLHDYIYDNYGPVSDMLRDIIEYYNGLM